VTRVKRRSEKILLAGSKVPSILQIPYADDPLPAVLLLHGLSSSKERLADSMGRALAARGIASLAIDLPLHGTRDDAIVDEARSNPLGLVKHWKAALAEAKDAIRWMSEHEAIDETRLSISGYSLGSYVALQTAAAERRIKTVLIAAGGDLPETPWTRMMRLISDPLKSVRNLKGRPLLMLHGKRDRTIKPEQAQRLYDAASQPKELRWYDSGHVLPADAATDAAAWLTKNG
jgi:predicted esterase